MPELPEVETIKRGLEPLIVKKKIEKVIVDAQTPKCFQGQIAQVEGSQVLAVRRRGKALLIDLDNGYTLLIHLRMTGQLIWRGEDFAKLLERGDGGLEARDKGITDRGDVSAVKKDGRFAGSTTSGDASVVDVRKHYDEIMASQFAAGHPSKNFTAELPNTQTRVTFVFSDGRLYFNDQRKFGFVKVLPTGEVEKDKFIAELAKEPWQMEATELIAACRRHKKAPIKAVLLDQKIIAGLGNIYADESLYYASVHPATPAGDLTDAQIGLILEGACKVMDASINSGGSTMATYIKPDGTTGNYLELFAKVFRRDGKPCERCGEIICKTRVAGRGTHFCPHCQQIKDGE